MDEKIKRNMRLILGVKRQYLEAVFKMLENQYGSMQVFFEKKLELKSEDLKQLRIKYLE